MPDARRAFFGQGGAPVRQIKRVGGRACLVVHHIYGVAALAGGKDGIHKIFAPGAKKPGGAHNAGAVWQDFHHGLFALKLGAGIDRGGLGQVGFFPGGFARAGKDEVGAVLHKKPAPCALTQRAMAAGRARLSWQASSLWSSASSTAVQATVLNTTSACAPAMADCRKVISSRLPFSRPRVATSHSRALSTRVRAWPKRPVAPPSTRAFAMRPPKVCPSNGAAADVLAILRHSIPASWPGSIQNRQVNINFIRARLGIRHPRGLLASGAQVTYKKAP